jgi:hypothetical protein
MSPTHNPTHNSSVGALAIADQLHVQSPWRSQSLNIQLGRLSEEATVFATELTGAFVSLSLPKMLSAANAFEISDIERMNIGTHQPGVWHVTMLHALWLAEVTIRQGQVTDFVLSPRHSFL